MGGWRRLAIGLTAIVMLVARYIMYTHRIAQIILFASSIVLVCVVGYDIYISFMRDTYEIRKAGREKKRLAQQLKKIKKLLKTNKYIVLTIEDDFLAYVLSSIGAKVFNVSWDFPFIYTTLLQEYDKRVFTAILYQNIIQINLIDRGAARFKNRMTNNFGLKSPSSEIEIIEIDLCAPDSLDHVRRALRCDEASRPSMWPLGAFHANVS